MPPPRAPNRSGIRVASRPSRTLLAGWRLLLALVLTLALSTAFCSRAAVPPITVTLDNFIRAETDLYFGRFVQENGLGTLAGSREIAPIDKQTVVRMNRDTIYKSGVFDLSAAPLTITLPNAAKRFMSMQVISEDHHTVEVTYAPGPHSYKRSNVGTRYVFILVRALANPQIAADLKAANRLLDAILVDQPNTGRWAAPDWDEDSRKAIRLALENLNRVNGATTGPMFGDKNEVDPVLHLIGTAVGWGGNPRSAAIYSSVYPKQNDGKTAYTLTVKNVPVDGFWSVSVYNAQGYFEKNSLDAYSLNTLTAKPNPDGSYTIQFGGDMKGPNSLPITPGWNYTVRLYRPRKEILDGTWKFPEARPSN